MANFFIGKREAMSSNSTKYGYSTDGICVKAVGGGYRSINGTYVDMAVTTDASCIVKETASIDSVREGQMIVMDACVFAVLEINTVNTTTKKLQLLNLANAQVENVYVDTTDKVVGILWDTFIFPEKAVDGKINQISMNEFTPAQLRDLAVGKATLEELRTPKTVESLEDILGKLIADVVARGAKTEKVD